MTLGVLRLYGARVREHIDGSAEVRSFHVRGPLRAPEHPVRIEPDASSAAVALVAACLSGGEARIEGFPHSSPQGDLLIVDHLLAFGCDASLDAGVLRAVGRPRRGVELDLSGEPDLAPPLAALAAGAAVWSGEVSEFIGLGTLPGKESSRIEVLADGLSRCGWQVSAGVDRLSIGAWNGDEAPQVLDPHGDHRMAFAFALLGLIRPGVRVAEANCVAKSWPGFWREMRKVARCRDRSAPICRDSTTMAACSKPAPDYQASPADPRASASGWRHSSTDSS
jgi:3-phosphoshikimate 1-carboxyvinyltransferase